MSEENPTSQDPERKIGSQAEYDALLAELIGKHQALQRAAQIGMSYYIPLRPQSVEPLHLRLGINSALVGEAGLAKLLMDKGVFTEAEYWQYQIEAMEREVRNWENALSEMKGRKITLH